jgi:uncharacterized protein (TIGR04222 family)
MNPLSFDDSTFFFAYLAAIVVVVWVVRWQRRAQEQTAPPTLSDMDPYAIAVLRAGVGGAIQLAFAHVTQRGWAVHEGFNVRVVPGATSPHVVEQTLIHALQTPRAVSEVFRLPELMTLLDGYQRQLETQGLLPDAARREQRQMLWRGGVGVLWLIAGARIASALSAGASIPFDVVTLAFLAVPFVRMAAVTRRTLAGDRLLADLTQRVRQQLPSLSTTEPWGPEQLLAGAVLGMSGMEIARRMRDAHSDTSVGGYSSDTSSSDEDHGAADSSDGDGGGESSCGGDGGCGGGGD